MLSLIRFCAYHLVSFKMEFLFIITIWHLMEEKKLVVNPIRCYGYLSGGNSTLGLLGFSNG